MMCEPLRGWRHVKGSDRRTRRDDAGCVRDRVDVPSRRAAKIRLVQDNRNTHDGARLDEAFPPAKARRILDRIAFHDTPKHGSWLHMAETEISIMDQQCLDRRLRGRRRWTRYRAEGGPVPHGGFDRGSRSLSSAASGP